MTNEKINIDEVIADSESAQAIMYEQSKGIDHAAVMQEIDEARKENEKAIAEGRAVDSWRFFTSPQTTPAEEAYMDACIKAVDGPTGRRF